MKEVTISIIDIQIDDQKQTSLHLVYENGVIGGCKIAFVDETPTILNIFVIPSKRGNGLCRRLMDKCHEIIVARGKKTVYLFVKDYNPMLDVYIRYGYRLTGQETEEGDLWMSKLL